MKIICSYTFGVHTRLTEKNLTNFIRHEIAEMKTLKKFDSQQHLSQPLRIKLFQSFLFRKIISNNIRQFLFC